MADQQLVRTVFAVQQLVANSGRAYWNVTDETGQDWKVWESNLANQALQLQGQLALMTVRIAPASDPSFGMNYTLRGIAPAPAGMAASPPLPLAQGQPQQPQMPIQQPQPMMPVQPGAQMNVPPMQPMAPAAVPQVMSPSVKTMGQGGNLSDADLTRIARSTAIDVVAASAFTPEDFRDEDDGSLDWGAVYTAAEAITKFILFRQHRGWNLGEEINPPGLVNPPSAEEQNEQMVMAEIQNEFPEFTEVQTTPISPNASAAEAQGPEVGWGE